MISFLTDAGVSLNEGQREFCAVTLFTDNIECKPVFEEQLRCFGFHLEQTTSEELSSNNNPLAVTLDSPDYKAFLNQLYDDIYVSMHIDIIIHSSIIMFVTCMLMDE